MTERILLNPSTLLAPVPVVLVSCAGKTDSACARPNLITLAWAGTICSDPPMLSISVRKSRWSYQQIVQSGEFVVNLVDRNLLWATDFCGVRSGADMDKFAQCKLDAIPAAGLTYAPAVAQSPLSLSCKVDRVIPLGTHDLFLANIVAVEVKGSLLDKQQKLHLDHAELVAFSHGEYFSLGNMLGFFGYSVASLAILKKRMPAIRLNRDTSERLTSRPSERPPVRIQATGPSGDPNRNKDRKPSAGSNINRQGQPEKTEKNLNKPHYNKKQKDR